VQTNVHLVSYGEYVESAESVDFGPIVERALSLTNFHVSIRDSSPDVIRNKPRIVRHITVAHIYLQR